MTDQEPTFQSGYPNQPGYLPIPPLPSQGQSRRRGLALVALGLLGGAVAGAVIATSVNAGAAPTGSATSSTSSSVVAAPSNMPVHGSAAHEDAEKPVTGAAAAKAQAAAATAAGGGTASAVTTDYTGSGYEVTVTKSDGSSVEIHLDSSFNAVQR